ncbi:Fanconi anemia group M protein isoform X3 [Ovis canadensis]|uniref:Fanconi anemia group M protein isoform X3 n=1 Tax=Ovis canadensis TaxID=37174 RepID=UPI00375074ED
MSGRQRTLFQTWGSNVSRSTGAPSCNSGTERPQSTGISRARFPAVAEAAGAAEAEPESDDDVLLVAVYEAEKQLSLENGGFCTSAGALWIYPTNCPVRDYQLHIARTALFCNTLVCLPTGLGKTFIAAVVMYNFYRWFPSGKVVFMAPTKPLVTQQIEACYRVMGIPQSHMAEMTGSTQAFTRKEIWGSKRVLFLTPQVMVNDLSRGACPAAEIKCLVIDEAHKALGNYAYCQVVRELVKYTNHFRILALSATPGSDIKAVQQVITNLLIGQIELRSEDSPDILPYSHERRVEKLVVPLGEELAAIQKAYVQILEAFASSLIQRNVLMKKDIPNLTKYQIILARDQFRKNPSPNIVGIQQGIIEGEFAICISLYHGYELLQQMGMRSLYFFLCGIMDGTKGMTRVRNELSRNADFMKLYDHLDSMFAHTRSTSASGISAIQKGGKDKKFCYSHPKLKKLEEVVVEHFKSWNAQKTSDKKCDETRVMIFSSFRDSVQEIAEMLLPHQPVIRVMTFVGHASGKSMKGFTQKEQLEVVKQFRSGGYNTLVSTCVGEEGLDIGEVDLIICFDAQKSPIRLIQRMGRTGRRRQGRIVVILAEGREERTYNQSQCNKRSIYKAISGNRQVLHFYQGSPRMVPDGVNPQLHKMFITHGVYEPEKPSRNLQRKSSIFSYRSGIKQSNSKDDWFLSEEEFKLWNRRYRLRDTDEIQEITLPQVQFLSLHNEENRPTEEPTVGIHQLSLSEWRLWQDHPLPTYQVDHSDRCHHFINIMQMIERMRHEEASENLKKDQPEKENKDADMEPLDTDDSSTAEHILQVDLRNGKRASDTGDVTAACTVSENGGLSTEKYKSKKQINLHRSCHSTEDEQLSSHESEDDAIFRRKSKKTKGNVLESPENQKNSEVDSPLQVVKKRRVPPNRLDLSSSDESDNFHKRDPQSEDFKDHKRNAKRSIKVRKRQNHLKLIARKFLDEEAELSQEDAEYVSSDENDGSENEQDSSLLDFLNDETQLSQAINDSEMRAVYMKSVRSPLMSNRYKIVHKKHNNINIFSQIPEQDETYLEDSFCVDEEESCKSQSSEEVCVDFNLITEDCDTNESEKYKTRRAVKLKQMKMRQNCARSKNKLSRIILLDDSSEEENGVKDKQESGTVVDPSTVPSGSSLQSRDHSNPVGNQLLNQRRQTLPNFKVPVSDVSDCKPQSRTSMESASSLFTTVSAQKDCRKFPAQLKGASALEDSGTWVPCCSNSGPRLADTHDSLRLPQEGHRTCILVDSREIVSGSEVVSSLRAIHGLQVEVCPLNGCDYIVSNRMVVERRSQSEMLNSITKNKLIDQIQHLQSMFERICVIVEKDREKTGDTSRMFRRTKSYDSLLTTLIGAGIRILFSSCQEETAGLLKELSLVEQRKNVGIHVPTVVNSNTCETLQFYLSIPNISYITALNMCHQFSSVKKMTNSTPQEISMYAQVTHQKAEEIYRYIHYIFDMQMLPTDLNQGSIKSDT